MMLDVSDVSVQLGGRLEIIVSALLHALPFREIKQPCVHSNNINVQCIVPSNSKYTLFPT